MQLTDIKTMVEAENFFASLQPASEDFPVDQLVVLLDNEEEKPKLALQILYLDGLEEQIENSHLLQFFITLPIEVNLFAALEVRELFSHLDAIMPLSSFSLHPDGFLYFRYIHLLPRTGGGNAGPVIMDIIWMIYYLIDTFSPILTVVGSGTMSAAEAIAAK